MVNLPRSVWPLALPELPSEMLLRIACVSPTAGIRRAMVLTCSAWHNVLHEVRRPPDAAALTATLPGIHTPDAFVGALAASPAAAAVLAAASAAAKAALALFRGPGSLTPPPPHWRQDVPLLEAVTLAKFPRVAGLVRAVGETTPNWPAIYLAQLHSSQQHVRFGPARPSLCPLHHYTFSVQLVAEATHPHAEWGEGEDKARVLSEFHGSLRPGVTVADGVLGREGGLRLWEDGLCPHALEAPSRCPEEERDEAASRPVVLAYSLRIWISDGLRKTQQLYECSYYGEGSDGWWLFETSSLPTALSRTVRFVVDRGTGMHAIPKRPRREYPSGLDAAIACVPDRGLFRPVLQVFTHLGHFREIHTCTDATFGS